jgi:phage major head subunit gpT-like protein
MAVINTGLTTKGIRGEFLNRLAATPTYYQDLAMRIPSTTGTETYKWLGTVPAMREWGNGRLAKGLRAESYSVENLKYEATLEVDRDELADDQLGQVMIRVGELAQRAATHKDYLIAQLLINGATAGYLAYDGLTFFNDAHVSGSSGNQDNDLTATAAAAAKTSAECKTALQAAIGAMLAFKDDQGEPMSLGLGGLAVVVPPSMYFAMLEAVQAAMLSSTTNVIAGIARVISLPWLTAGTTFYTLKTDGVVRPFIFQDREPLEFVSQEADSDEGFKREKYLYGVRARYRMTYGYWQYAVRTVFNN